MKIHAISLGSILITMLALDALWLSIMVKRFYPAYIGHLMADTLNIAPAVVFYLVYAFGLFLFVVQPALENGQGYLQAFLLGAAFGFVAYSTYDLTNHATLKDWPLIVTAVDVAWGSFLTGTVSVSSVFLTRFFG